MANELTQAKSNLARLMSEENLIIEQRNGVPSAFFDTKSRLLVIPTLKEELSTDIVDLFLTHECAHALFTPENWVDLLEDKKVNKSITNVLEDARIEKMIKHKYPGLRTIYTKAYKALAEMDFFGLSSMNMYELNLIDKINLTMKIGFVPQISFSEKEKEYLVRAESTTTFDEVVELSLEIQQYMKKEYKKEQVLGNAEFGDEFSFDFDSETLEDTDDETPDQSMDSFSGKTENGQESDSSSEEDFSGEDEDGMSDFEKMERSMNSSTSDFAEKKMKELYSESNKQSIYIDLPKIDLNKLIVPYTEVYSRLKSAVGTDCYNKNAYNLFKKENSSVISYLIKEFQLKKNAEGRKKIRIAKTGDINFNKLFGYKVSDDIFKRSEIVAKTQSHGLVFFLDWSSSMEEYMQETIKQLMSMMLFCKKMNIPFEVYAFTNQYSRCFNDPERRAALDARNYVNTLMLDVFHLMNLFSSKMPNNVFVEACNYMLSFQYNRFSREKINHKFSYNASGVQYAPDWFELGATPLNHSILTAKKVVEEFQLSAKVKKVNCIFLTDGESHSISYGYERSEGYVQSRYLTDWATTNYIRDIKTRNTMKMDIIDSMMDETNKCVEFLKQISNFRVFGFRLVGKNDFKRSFKSFFRYDDDYTEKHKTFNKNNCVKSTKTSFDEFYVIKTSINEKEEVLSGIGEKEAQASIARKFQKSLSAKVTNKVFLNRFIEFIS